ncbi:MAG: site-specific integrase [Proteobacteria bacterium]|jgi:integrase|nr:site-specific integrase [Pseudomonadota bacterium]
MSKPTKHRNRWRTRWVDENGKRRSEVYENPEQAKVMLARRQLQVRETKLGLRTGACPDKTFADLADYWLENYAPNKRSEKDDRSIIEHHLRPELGAMKLIEIGARQIDRYRALRGNLAPKTVANQLVLLKSMLNKAFDLGWLATQPRFKIPRVPHNSADYSYLRTEGEIQRFQAAAREEGEGVWILYQCAVYTGMRAGELAGLRREDIDLDHNIITVQHSYDGPTKSGRIRRIPIFDVLRPSLTEWLLKVAGMPVVFPNEAGKMHGPSARIFQEMLHGVLDRAGFPLIKRRGKARHYVTFHGLRHTFASHFMMRGGDLFKLQALLGHQSITMTQRYAHLAPDAFAGEHGRFGGAAEITGVVLTLPTATRPEASTGSEAVEERRPVLDEVVGAA